MKDEYVVNRAIYQCMFPEGYRQSDRVYEWQVGGN